MPNVRLLFVPALALLCACSSIDGLYAPACVAYEGDEIELIEGRFTWRRFTDERRVDEQGQPIDPFPGYPKQGIYEYRDPVLILTPDSDSENVGFFLMDEKSGVFLLTGAEKQRYDIDGQVPECALRRAGED
ncbi:MAG: hypothetical protein EX272_14010 [Chromatiales bacterium]|nr:MAG: hypothetical protein EX272_14010 [Chromatiales bacterium]